MSRPLQILCPRISPEWELAARLALVKPKPCTRRIIEHNDPRQRWPRAARRVIVEISAKRQAAAEFPRGGEHRAIIRLSGEDIVAARKLAREISRSLPHLWFVLDPWYIRGGVFYHRVGKYKLELVRSNRVRLRRSVRFGFFGDLDHAIAPPRPPARQHQPAQ